MTLAPFLLAGCAMTTDTGATSAPAETSEAVVAQICTAWLPVSWSSQDTDQTIAEAKANNRARIGFGCT